MNYPAAAIEIIDNIATRQMQGETFEHIVASEAARYQTRLHERDGGDEPATMTVGACGADQIGCGEWC